MESEKKNTGLYIAIAILCLLVIVLGGYIVSNKLLNKKQDNNNLEIGNVKGLYKAKGSNPNYETYYELLLNDDGTFMFLDDTSATYGKAGNYYVNGNEIVLNSLFEISGGMSIKALSNDSKDRLTYNNGTISYTKYSIILTKDSSGEKDFINSMGTLNDWLKNGYFTNTNTNDTTISKKLVNNLSCKNSKTTFNNISVILEQKDNDGVCIVQKFTVNGKDIKNNVSSWVDSYEIFDKSLIIMSGDTSGIGLYIYNTSNDSMTKLYPEDLKGYWAKSYTTNNNEIIINGVGCGEQCGYSESNYNKKATFKMTYSNGNFSSPNLVS